MANETYSFEILAEVSKARKAVDSFAKESQKQLDSISGTSSTTALATGFLAVANIASTAFNAISGFVSSSIQEALQAEKANIQLANSMRIVGDFSKNALDNFNEFATALAKTSAATDNEIISALALAKTFQLTNKEAQNVVRAATDLSAITGDSLNSSVEKLSKTYNNFISKELKQLAPELKHVTETQARHGEVVRILGERYRGTAATINDSFSGAVGNLGKQYQKTKEETGKLVTEFRPLVDLLKALPEAIDVTASSFVRLSKAFVFNGGPIGQINEVLKDLSPALDDLVKKIDETLKGFGIDFGKVLDDFGTKFDDTLKRFGIDFGSSLSSFGSDFNETLKGYGIDFKKSILRFGIDFTKASESQDALLDEIKAAGRRGQQVNLAKQAEEAAAKKIDKLREDNALALEIETNFNAKKNDLEKLGLSDREKIIEESRKTEKLIIDARNQGLIDSDAKKNKLLIGLHKDTSEKLLAEEKIRLEKVKALNATFLNDPLKAISGAVSSGAKVTKDQAVAAGAGFAVQVTKGAEGAKKLVVDSLALAGQAIAGIPPAISGPLLDALSQGPEKVREMVRQFADAVPVIVQNILEALPVVLDEILKAVPRIVNSLVLSIPEILKSIERDLPDLLAALIAEMPAVAIQFATALIADIPKIVEVFAQEFLKIPERFAKALLAQIPGGGAVAKAGGGILGGIGNVIGNVGKVFGFAEGGTTARNPVLERDGGMAKIGSNETIVDSELTDWLRQMKNSGGFGGGPKEVVVNIGLQQFARIMLDARKAGHQI